ncbi:MAG: CBS domain-containing protein [Candidatus Thermoplasmatota archaeon]|nr:CBS domain-containing protein [Candidatus Thermoplasmatota archaeon]
MSLDKPIKDIRVSDVLDKSGKVVEPAKVRSDASLRDAVLAIVKDSETRKVYVVDDKDTLVGTITLETLLRHAGYRMGVRETGMTSFLRMLAEMSNDKVHDVMAKPIRVRKDELLVNVTKLMVENHLNDLPVVDNQDKLVQELNGLDILKLSAEQWE